LVTPRDRLVSVSSFRRVAAAGLFALFVLPGAGHAAAPSCSPKATTASSAPADVAHYEMTKSAALASSVPAQVELANLYRRGHGVAPDLVQAYAWLNVAATRFSSAAEQRDAVAICLDSSERLKAQLLSVKLLTEVGTP